MPRFAAVSLSAAALLASAALAGPFTEGNLVVMEVSSDNPGGGGAVRLAEFSPAGVRQGNLVQFPTSGIDAMSMPDLTNHDRHVHRSPDGKWLTLMLYNTAPRAATSSIGGPDADAAALAPRTVALLNAAGAVDLSTRLANSYNNTGVRGVVTVDGNAFWICGDNASGATASGGLHYALKGGSASNNLSQVQTMGGTHTPDNIRDVNIFDGQLYDASGSSASVGKALFTVGSGLPTSGSQTLARATNDNVSVSCFTMLDLNPGVSGRDVLYTATSSADALRKYIKSPAGTWSPAGLISFVGIEDVVARANPGGSVTIYAGGTGGIAIFTDLHPLTENLAGALPEFIMTPAEGYTFGGFDFAPVAPCLADIGATGGAPGSDGVLDNNDFIVFIDYFFASDARADLGTTGGQPGHDGVYDNNDFIVFIDLFFQGCN